MTKITFNKTGTPVQSIGIGDWIIITDLDGDELLHAVVQVSGGKCNVIAVTDNDLNRNSEPIEWNVDGGKYNALSKTALDHFCKNGKTMRKVNVEIIVTEIKP